MARDRDVDLDSFFLFFFSFSRRRLFDESQQQGRCSLCQARVRLLFTVSLSFNCSRREEVRAAPDAFFLFRSPSTTTNDGKKKKLSLRFPDPLCSTCDALASALLPTDESALDADCRSCCTPEDDERDSDASSLSSSSSSSKKSKPASSAVLEVCRSRLRSYRHVDEFVKHKLPLFKGQVKLKDRYNSPPRIHFLDARGKRVESGGGNGGGARVDHWRTEDIESFLRERLEVGRAGNWQGKREERASSSSTA